MMPEYKSTVISLILGRAGASACYPTYDPDKRYSVGDAVSSPVVATATSGPSTIIAYNFVCSSLYWCNSAHYAPGGVHSDIAWTKEDAACTADAAVIHASGYSPASLFIGSKEAYAYNYGYDADAVKFVVVASGEDEASSLRGTSHSNPVTKELGGEDDAHEDDGKNGYKIMRERGGGIPMTDGRREGATTSATANTIEEAASRAAEPLNPQALVSTHPSTNAVIIMADLTERDDGNAVLGEEDVVIAVEGGVDEENGDVRDSADDDATVLQTNMVYHVGIYEYGVDGLHADVEADPTAIDVVEIEDVEITSISTVEMDDYDADAVKFAVVASGEDEASSLRGTSHSNPVTKELGGEDDAHEDDGKNGYKIMRERGGGIPMTDGRREGATTSATANTIEEAASRAAEPLNPQALVSTHPSTNAVIIMADLTERDDGNAVLGEEDVVIAVEGGVDEENGDVRDSADDDATVLQTNMVYQVGTYEYGVDGLHVDVEADPTAIDGVEIDDVEITSISTIEMDRSKEDDVASTMTRILLKGEGVEDDDDEILMSTTGVIMNGIMMTGESAESEQKNNHAKGRVEDKEKLTEYVR